MIPPAPRGWRALVTRMQAPPGSTRDQEPTSFFETSPPLSLERLGDAFRDFAGRMVGRLPNLVVAVVFLAFTVVLARAVRRGVEHALGRTSTEAYVHLLVARLAYLGVILVGVVVSLSIAGVDLAVLVGSLGLLTVALGLALQDIVANFVAGILLLLEHPFTKGDYIVTQGAEGEVEDIRIRATQLRAADGQFVLVPNKLLFTNVLTNSSATLRRRVEATVSVPVTRDTDRLRADLLAAGGAVEGVAEEPLPRLLTEEVGAESMRLSLWCWVDPRLADPLRVRSEVLEEMETVLRQARADDRADRPDP